VGTDRGSSSLGALLYRFRLRTGMSQQELAGRAGVSVRGLRDLEQGRVTRPRPQSVLRLAAALELSAADQNLVLAATASPVQPGRLQVNVLGPLAMRRDGEAVELRSAMVRDLLGLLAVQPGRLVSRDEIVDVLWGEHPPRTCVRLVHGYVGQLREVLDPGRQRRGAAGPLRLVTAGYRLDLAADELDLVRFDELLAAGARADALACWRGPVLASASARLRAHPAVIAVEQRRLAAVLDDADDHLAGGSYDQAGARLRALAADEPLHEGVAARLILALAGAGEQAAALRHFGNVRDRLRDDLGIEPGPELRDAHVRVLRGELPGAAADAKPDLGAHPVPAQLPADVADFTGREEHLARLDALLPAGASQPAVVIAPVTGTAGVGKTALAVHWAHQVAARFPDGQLYVNLRGYDPGAPLPAVDALARFLRALGVPAERVPTEIDEAADLYRTMLSTRRVLILLDNAHSPEQVRPLLPGGAASMVLVTSRDALAGLVARDGARRVSLDVLTADEAIDLLGRILGADRVRAEPDATAELARLCAYLPLALRIAAANIALRPHGTIDRYVTRLAAGNRLAALEVAGDGQAAVRAAIALSYESLPAPQQRLFRLLGRVFPGTDFSAPTAAALTGGAPGEAVELLDQLAHVHLLDQHQPGRYSCHDLLRLYARERCDAEDGAAERDAAGARLHRYYLDAVDAAARQLYPEKLRLPLTPGGTAPAFDQASASAWLDAERANLVAAITAVGADPVAWQLTDGLRGYFFLRLSIVDWATAARAGLAAAQAAGDASAQAAAELSLADLAWFRGHHDQAIERYGHVLDLARGVGWVECQAAALANLGLLHRQAARWGEAIDHYTQALDLNRIAGRLAGQAVSLANLGVVYWELGRLTAAADCYARALELHRRIGSRTGAATTMANLGEVNHLLGRLDEARTQLDDALAIHREVGDRGSEAETLRCLAAVHRDAGRDADAQAAADAALTLARDTGHHRLEADAYNTLGAILCRQGEPGKAAAYHQRALTLARDAGARHTEAQALIGLAALGGPDARDHAKAALALTSEAGFRLLEGLALTAVAAVSDPPDARGYATRALGVHADTGHRVGLAATHALLARIAGDDAAAREHAERARGLYIAVGAAWPAEPPATAAAGPPARLR